MDVKKHLLTNSHKSHTLGNLTFWTPSNMEMEDDYSFGKNVDVSVPGINFQGWNGHHVGMFLHKWRHQVTSSQSPWWTKSCDCRRSLEFSRCWACGHCSVSALGSEAPNTNFREKDSLDENLDEDDSSDDVFREVFFWDMSKYFKSILKNPWDLKTNGLEIPEKNPPKKESDSPKPLLFGSGPIADSARWWTCTS